MTIALKRLYSFNNKNDSAVSFVRRGIEYTIDLPNPNVIKIFPYLQTRLSLEHIERLTGVMAKDLVHLKEGLQQENLLEESETGHVSGAKIYACFREVLSDWMREAFSSAYWEIMLSGKGSRQLYIGYLFELYHYTKNANSDTKKR